MTPGPTAAKTVLVLGGGVGGLVATTRLRQRLAPENRIVLIDREPQHLFQPSLLWIAVGRRAPDRVVRPLERLRRKGIEVVTGEITGIDPVERTVIVDGRALTGDAMIIALGAELAPEMIAGLAAAGHNAYTMDGAVTFRHALDTFSGGRIVVLTAAPAYKCPAAPYEAAMLIEAALRKRHIRDRVQVDLYAAEPGPMGVAGPEVSRAVRQLVESKGIAYHPEHQVTAADPEAQRLAFANGVTAQFDLLLYVPPHRCPGVVRQAGLTNESGWVPANRRTFETQFPMVYAIGDVTSVPLAMGKPLPKAGVFAHHEAEVVAANLAQAWNGGGAARTFDGHGQCFLEAGDGRAGLGAGDFYAEPTPQITLHRPSRFWHWGKVLYERRWLRRWF